MYNHYIPLPFNAISHTQQEIYFYIFLNIFGFFAIGMLSSYLSENLKKSKITLAKKSKDLKDLQAFHQNVIDCMSGGLIVTDLIGDITFLNQAAEEITGYTIKDINGKHFLDLFTNTSLSFNEIINDLEQHKIFRFEGECKAKSGEIKFLGASLTPLRGKEEVDKGYILIFQDLTELRMLEEEVKIKDRMAIIGELATGIAHELRNPLAAVTGSVQLITKEDFALDQQQQLMNIILKEAERLNKIIINFLEYAKPLKFRPVKIDITKLLKETITLLENSKAIQKKHTISIHPQKGKFVYYCDPNQMKQVFWNLAHNALKAMPQGGKLEITLDKFNVNGITINFTSLFNRFKFQFLWQIPGMKLKK